MNPNLLHRRLLALLFISIPVSAGSQTIRGTVTSADDGRPVPGAAVVVSGTVRGVSTGLDGRFEITGLPSGSYSLEASMLSYLTEKVSGVEVSDGVVAVVDIAMTPSVQSVDEVVVTAVRRLDTEAGVLQASRTATGVMTALSARSISRAQDRDASQALRRIPGISVVDDRFIVARGLSQRYNNVWVDNASVPSAEADSRAFSFDLIPGMQIDNIAVLKSPVPEIPADFTGGFVLIRTRDMPAENSVSLSYGTGFNDRTHFRGFRYSPGGLTDWLGFDGGRRSVSGGVNGRLDNDDAAAVTSLTRTGFNNDWSERTRRPVPDQRFSLSFGRLWESRRGSGIALTGALNYSCAMRSYTGMENSRYGVYNKAEDRPEYLYKYTDDQYNTDVRLGALLNLAYSARGHRLYFRNMFNRLGRDRYTVREGWRNISSLYLQEKTEYNYSSRSAYTGRLSGVHETNRARLDWNFGYSHAGKDQPDRRMIDRQQNDLVGDRYYGLMGITQNSIRREFMRLDEHAVSGGANYGRRFGPSEGSGPELKAGLYADFRSRKYRNRSFSYRFRERNLPDGFMYGDPVDDILQPANFDASKLYVYDDTDNRDSYAGRNLLLAAYAGLNIRAGAVDIYAGVRYEASRTTLTAYTRTDEWASRNYRYDYADPFPSVNVTWRVSDNHQLRAAYGMSTNRPEFREVSSSVYYDFDLFSDVMGNPRLRAAYIHNADLRYEWYPSVSEVVSAGVFCKYFRNPIEVVILDAGGSYTYTFENADRARLFGLEIDVRKNLDFIGLRNFSLVLNCAFIAGRVMFGEGSREHDRAMQGQSPYLVNAGLFYSSSGGRFSAGVMYNRIGKRIVGVGKADTSGGGSIDNDIPDMYEMPRDVLDVVLGFRFGRRWELKLNVRDVLAQSVRFCQFPEYTDDAGVLRRRSQTAKRFMPGRSASAAVAVTF